MNRSWALAVGAMMLLVAASSPALACTNGPFVETWENAGTAEWTAIGGNCMLQASVALKRPSAATAHFRRADPEAPLRLSFVVNPPPLTTLNSDQAVTLATGTARSVPAGGPSVASLLRIVLSGNPDGTRPVVGFGAACSGGVNGLCIATSLFDFTDFPLRITVELDMGAGSAGQLRAWLGDDTSGTPQAVLVDLDNARWGGVDRLGIGISDVSEQLASTIANQPFSFSEVTVSDPQLFWGDFEGDIAGNVVANAGPINVGFIVNGSTCGGSSALPVLASGSTMLGGPSSIHSMSISGTTTRVLDLQSSTPGMSLFACPSGSGPSGPCIGATYAGLALPLSNLAAGSYQVVVGSLQSNCGTYEIAVAGPLDEHP